MKSKNYEVLILVFLMAVILVYAGTVYLIKPLRSRIDEVSQRITMTENEIKTMYYTVSSYPSKCEYLKQLGEEMAPLAQKFYADEYEEGYLEHIRFQVKSTKVEFASLGAQQGNLKASSLGLSEKSAEAVFAGLGTDGAAPALKQEKFNNQFKKLVAKDSRLESDIKTTTITLEAFGSYRQILSFIEGLTEGGKSILVSSMTLDIAENISLDAANDPEVRLMITLVFVDIPEAEAMYLIEAPEELLPYNFPQDIIYGTYRSSTDALSSLLMGLFK